MFRGTVLHWVIQSVFPTYEVVVGPVNWLESQYRRRSVGVKVIVCSKRTPVRIGLWYILYFKIFYIKVESNNYVMIIWCLINFVFVIDTVYYQYDTYLFLYTIIVHSILCPFIINVQRDSHYIVIKLHLKLCKSNV